MKSYSYRYLIISFWGIFSFTAANDTLQDRYVIYTANINAMLQNCGCGATPLGGIDRIKTYVDSFRTVHPGLILLDGGDFLNSYPFPELNAATLEAFGLLRYDLHVPGDHEFMEGLPIISKINRHFGGSILLSNVSWPEQKAIVPVYRSDKLQITAFVNPACLNLAPVKREPEITVSDEFYPIPEQDDMITILIYHGYLSGLRERIKRIPAPDLVLLAHDQFAGVEYLSGVPVAGVGKDGEQVAVIRFTDRSAPDIELVKITEYIKPDPQIIRISEQLEQKMGRN